MSSQQNRYPKCPCVTLMVAHHHPSVALIVAHPCVYICVYVCVHMYIYIYTHTHLILKTMRALKNSPPLWGSYFACCAFMSFECERVCACSCKESGGRRGNRKLSQGFGASGECFEGDKPKPLVQRDGNVFPILRVRSYNAVRVGVPCSFARALRCKESGEHRGSHNPVEGDSGNDT